VVSTTRRSVPIALAIWVAGISISLQTIFSKFASVGYLGAVQASTFLNSTSFRIPEARISSWSLHQ
jgi:hypothetical protein